jgi:hypothetical protein
MQVGWARVIDDHEWNCYRRAIEALRNAGVRILLGGGFALATYVGHWRNTKDIDFYIMERDREAAVRALTEAGFEDLFPKMPYDRNWIYRSTCAGVIVDIIWAMANKRAHADEIWFEHAATVSIRRESLQVIPLEEFLWCKLYIIQRDHCDWVDIFNVLYAVGKRVDWDHLLWRLENDWPLLHGLLSVYGWVCPRRALELPEWLRKTLQLPKPEPQPRGRWNRIRLLDSRNWFAAQLPKEQPLEV